MIVMGTVEPGAMVVGTEIPVIIAEVRGVKRPKAAVKKVEECIVTLVIIDRSEMDFE